MTRITLASLFAITLTVGQPAPAQWMRTGMDSTDFLCLAALGPHIYAGYGGPSFTLLCSSDLGATWTEWPVQGKNIFSLSILDSVVFVGTVNMLFFSTDFGLSWIHPSVPYPPPFPPDMGPAVWDFAEVGSDIFMVSGWLFRSSDRGQTWSRCASIGEVGPLAVIGNALYAAVGSDIYRSKDHGDSWEHLSKASFNVGVMAALGGTLFVTGANYGDTSNTFLVSPDSGKTWRTTGLAGLPLCVAGQAVFVGTPQGIYASEDTGSTWRPVNEGLLVTNINQRRTLAANDRYLFVGINGVWYRPLEELTGVENNKGIVLPPAFHLEQNYPNPFNPTTTIRYALPRRSRVTLTVFNMLGQQVVTLVDGEVEAGEHEVTMNSDGLASGMYFYCFSTGGYVQTRKMSLLR